MNVLRVSRTYHRAVAASIDALHELLVGAAPGTLALAHPLFVITGAEIETPTVLQVLSARPACNHGDDLCRAHRLRLRFADLPVDDVSSESALAIFQVHARPEWDAGGPGTGALS
ncbi:hypothetical protein GCM10022222_64180 [Amycolatopsis ultiminotia]|uniref:Uncharacterized protein n=1 Tax=Amycolatopsis ultiminotia TaxID=543629 RepID=A0ABP6XR10_9PSEU